MIFALLITGVGSLVILYSIYYLSARNLFIIFTSICFYLWVPCSGSYFLTIFSYYMRFGN
ncbi:hypothetical protein ACI2OX_05445 [Bacillus sp. N9]